MTRLRIPSRRAALLTGLAVGTVLTLAAAITLWRPDPATTAASVGAGPSAPAMPPVTAENGAPKVMPSGDPVTFARSVATTLFAWDTTAGLPVDAYRDPIVAVGDPAGIETPGLVADLTMYLPPAETWEFLTRYSTRQWLDITAAVIPATWPAIAANAPEGSLAEGTTAVTIDGVRHRAGQWEGETAHDRFTVAFTVFVVCGPTYPTCHVLRLGALDTPMR